MSQLVTDSLTSFPGNGGDVVKDPIPAIYGYIGVLISAVCFYFLNGYVTDHYGPPKSLRTPADAWQWTNLFVSCIHAAVIGVWDLTCFYFLSDMNQDMILNHHWYAYAMVAVSTGYFVYDYLDIIVNDKVKDMPGVCIHHTVVIVTWLFNLTYCYCIGYTCVALLAEINSVFLHIRKLLQMAQYPFHHWLYRLNSCVNVFTFLVFRFGVMFFFFYALWVSHSRITTLYMAWLSIAVLALAVINIVLFIKLAKSDILRSLRRGQS